MVDSYHIKRLIEISYNLIKILIDMRMHLQHQSVLKAFHPNAMDLYNSCTDLEEVCNKCQDPNFVYVSKVKKLFND